MAGFKEETGPGMVIARALVVSVIMALAMMLIAFGFMYLFSANAELNVPTAVFLIVFAISFIIAAILLERSGISQVSSLIGGMAVALCATILVVALVSGIYFIQKAMLYTVDSNTILTGFAICLIASLVINRLTLKL